MQSNAGEKSPVVMQPEAVTSPQGCYIIILEVLAMLIKKLETLFATAEKFRGAYFFNPLQMQQDAGVMNNTTAFQNLCGLRAAILIPLNFP